MPKLWFFPHRTALHPPKIGEKRRFYVASLTCGLGNGNAEDRSEVFFTAFSGGPWRLLDASWTCPAALPPMLTAFNSTSSPHRYLKRCADTSLHARFLLLLLRYERPICPFDMSVRYARSIWIVIAVRYAPSDMTVRYDRPI